MTPDYRSQVLGLCPEARLQQYDSDNKLRPGWYWVRVPFPDGGYNDLTISYSLEADAWKYALEALQEDLWKGALGG